MVVRVVVHGLRGEKFIIDLCDTVEQFQSITVLQLREKIHEKIPYICCCENPEKVQLIFIGRRLDDSSALLISYGIQHMSAIHMVVKVPGGGGGPGWGDGGMGDKEGKNRSMERLFYL